MRRDKSSAFGFRTAGTEQESTSDPRTATGTVRGFWLPWG